MIDKMFLDLEAKQLIEDKLTIVNPFKS